MLRSSLFSSIIPAVRPGLSLYVCARARWAVSGIRLRCTVCKATQNGLHPHEPLSILERSVAIYDSYLTDIWLSKHTYHSWATWLAVYAHPCLSLSPVPTFILHRIIKVVRPQAVNYYLSSREILISEDLCKWITNFLSAISLSRAHTSPRALFFPGCSARRKRHRACRRKHNTYIENEISDAYENRSSWVDRIFRMFHKAD